MTQKEHDVKVTNFIRISNEIVNLYNTKNKDYDDSFGKTFRKLGIISAITRMGDKMNRFEALGLKVDRILKGGGTEQERVNLVADESIVDTLKDIAAYAIMTIIELEDDEQRSQISST